MVKTCKIDECPKQPVFGIPGTKKATHCGPHGKPLGMINVTCDQCKIDGCTKQPIYGVYGTKKATHCSSHGKELGLINIKHSRCKITECGKHPSYAIPGAKKPTHCATHGNELGLSNIFSSLCKINECPTRPSYGIPGTTERTHCARHGKELGLVDIASARCKINNCDTIATYGTSGSKKATHCGPHGKELGLVDIISPHCVLCGMIRSQKKYDWYCFGCYCFTFPDKAIVRNHKTKENQIMSDLLKVYSNIIRDSTIIGGCSKRRPDGLLKLEDYNIIIEIDENQHNASGYSCENKRTMEIFQDLGNSPLTVIRFNPDKFDKEKSLFTITRDNGAPKIRDQKKYELDVAKLVDTIDFHINNQPDSEVNVVLLRYDTK